MQARVKVDLDRVIGKIDRNIYGQFLSRRPGCSEGGLYSPESSTADEFGLRRDVVSHICDLHPPLIRWPGGCTGTSYHWQDGVGPVKNRPKKIDLHFGWAAQYGFGTDEFIAFCKRIGAEPHLNVATGTGTLEEAAGWLEYCNGKLDTQFANLRRRFGHDEPYNVKYWQIGNEVYGNWEIGQYKAADYALLAREWAKALRRVDPSISLIAVGGNESDAPAWAWDVVPQVAPYVDYVSYHTYWSPVPGCDPWYKVQAGPHRAEQAMEAMSAVIRMVRQRNHHSRDLAIAVTEWNASPIGTMMANHPELNPFRPTYHLRDALAVASFINIMQRHCREIKLATVAQSINVVGLIMAQDEQVWIEPVYWPLWMQVRYSGPLALDAWVECEAFDEPMPEMPRMNHEPPRPRPIQELSYLDCSATLDPDQRKLFLSMVNRHAQDALQVHIAIPEVQVQSHGTLHLLFHEDGMAMNSPAQPNQVAPTEKPMDGLNSHMIIELAPHSYSILELDLA